MTRRSRDPVPAALTHAAKEGSLSAAFLLGRLYDEGWGVRRNYRLAFRWYLVAARGNLPEAFYFVASAYLFGHGVSKNTRKAFEWFQRSSRAGDLQGAYMEALSVLEGTGARRNVASGLRLLLRAARRGSHDAMDFLSAHYSNRGRLRQAKLWAERAIKAGDIVAPLRLREIKKLEAR